MNLLMLTKFFPYGTGEAFIENEIEEISKYYEKIIIIACEVDESEATIVRKVPTNVQYFGVYGNNKKNKKKDLFKSLFRFLKPNKSLKDGMYECRKIKEKLFLAYFEEKAQRIFKFILKKDIISKLKKEDYILYSYWLFTTARVGLLINSQYPAKYLCSRAHGYDLYKYRHKLNFLPYRKLFLDNYDNIFPCSKNGESYLKKDYPDYSSKIKYSYLGTRDFGVNKLKSEKKFNILSCSRVSPEKRIEKIIEGLSLLEKENVEITWLHIGDGKGLNKLEEKANKCLRKINFKFLGNLKNEEVIKFYQNNGINLFVNVSNSEGLPVSIMEAISFGIPVLATDVGGTSEIVINGETGRLLKKDFTKENFSEEILKIIKDKNYFNLRNNCRKYWVNNFKADNNYKNLMLFIKNSAKEKC